MSLRLRLSVILTSVLLATVFVTMTYLMLNVRQAISDELNSSVEFSSRLIALSLRFVPSDKLEAMTDQLGSDLARVGNTRHLRIGMTTDPAFSGVETELPAPDRVPQWFVRLVHPEPITLVRVVQIGEGPEHIVIRADAGDEISESWREFRPLMLMLVVFGVVANALVFLVLGRSLRSLQSVARAFQSIEEGDYETTVPLVGVPDVDVIVSRFNHMREVLKQSKDETQSLAQRSLAIQEDERRRLAQELHDELGQSISAIKALAVAIRDHTPPCEPTIIDSANTVVDVSTEIYARVRGMMANLRPFILDELGLVSALQTMIDDWNSHHEESFCEFQVEGLFPDLADDIAINCYRIVQEALTNIARHASAERAAVVVRYIDGVGRGRGAVKINIDDDGIGFNLGNTPRGLGLVGIDERVEVMQGKLTLRSSPRGGTHIDITVPV